MYHVSRAGDWRVDWVQAGRRIAVAQYTPAMAGGLLAVAAPAEGVAPSGSGHPPPRLVQVLLGLACTLPLALLWTQPSAAVTIGTVACVLALRPFHLLTVAGLAAELAGLYRAGRHGPA